MEEITERLGYFRKNIISAFNHQCDLFDSRLQRELAELHGGYATELQAPAAQEELDRLRSENRSLRSKLERAAQRKVDKSIQTLSSSDTRLQSSGTSTFTLHVSSSAPAEKSVDSHNNVASSEPALDTIEANREAPRNLVSLEADPTSDAGLSARKITNESESLEGFLDTHPFLKHIFDQRDAKTTQLEVALKQVTDKARKLRDDLLAEREQRIRDRSSYKAGSRTTKASKSLGALDSSIEQDPVHEERHGTAPATEMGASSTDYELAQQPMRASSAPQVIRTSQRRVNSEGKGLSSSEVTVPNSSDSTNSDQNAKSYMADGDAYPAQNSPSDVPVVISKRSLKRKRRTNTLKELQQVCIKTENDEASEERITRIKTEHENVPHFVEPSYRTQIPNDSIDLDDVSLPLITEPSQQHPGQETAPERRQRRQTELNAQVPQDLRGAENAKLALQSLHDEKQHSSFDSSIQQHYPPASQEAILIPSDPPEQTEDSPNDVKVPKFKRVSGDIPTVKGNASALKPKTPNPRVASRSPAAPKAKVDVSEKILAITEDGDDYEPNAINASKAVGKRRTIKVQTPPTWKENQAHNNRMSAYEWAEGGFKTPPATDKPKSSKRDFRDPNTHSIGQTPASSLRATGSNRTKQKRRLDMASFDGAASPMSSSEPRPPRRGLLLPPVKSLMRLRDRPVDELQPGDFVLNPACNFGVNYAYSEVVRKRAERKCLPNCTIPGCCGDKIGDFTRIGGFKAPSRPSLGNELRGISRSEDDQLIIDYLGCNPARLDHMPTVEKEDVLRKAIPWKFGQDYGRHRNIHERPASPPGFWRTEMPSTQELEQDRGTAEELKRRTVEERRREALHSRGRWKFRDELAHM
ncbi:MAG: hypothetical protein MMC23_007543 [Stictis urceolatum]|nr:hypothetical protein [Stictis urceolata]